MGLRPYYADYANHMLRFYARNSEPEMIYKFRTRTDEINWKACQRVLSTIPEEDREVVLDVYRKPLFLEDAINEYAAEHNASAERIWTIVISVSKRVAQARGLV